MTFLNAKLIMAACSNITSIALVATWVSAPPRTADVDGYYVSLHASRDGPPFAITTTSLPTAQLIDLLPSHTYWLRWHSHSVADSAYIGWGWNTSSAPAFACTTSAAPDGAPHTITRVGALASSNVSLSWSLSSSPSNRSSSPSLRGYRVELAYGGTTTRSIVLNASAGRSATFSNLPSATTFEVNVVALIQIVGAAAAKEEERRSDTVMMRTSDKGDTTRHMAMYRISEFQNEVDFLSNHDSASYDALAALLTRQASTVNVTDACIAALNAACPALRGLGKKRCLPCARAASSSVVVQECGGTLRAAARDFANSFFCGEGWPSFSIVSTPIARHCVASLPAPTVRSPTVPEAGWAPYLSCDAPEAGDANTPRSPLCICQVYWDRSVISHQPSSTVLPRCAASAVEDPSVDIFSSFPGPCNCTADGRGGIFPAASGGTSALATKFIGQTPVYLPYCFYSKAPRSKWPNSTLAGVNWSTPRDGTCSGIVDVRAGWCSGVEGGDASSLATLMRVPGFSYFDNDRGDSSRDEETKVQVQSSRRSSETEVMWRREATSQLIYYEDLFQAGWRTDLPHDSVTNDAIASRTNILAMARAWSAALRKHTTPRCCGC